MAFSFIVEVLNMTMRKRLKKKPVELREPRIQKGIDVTDEAH
jgi:hypothetical protein